MGRKKGSRNGISKAAMDKFINKTGIEKKYLPCSENCGRQELVDDDIVSVICPICVQKKCPVDSKLLHAKKNIDPSKTRPRGWQFTKEFVDSDGKVYHSGVEVPELKGTLPITDVIAVKAAQKLKSKEKKLKKAKKLERDEAKLIKEFKLKKKQKLKETKKNPFFEES